MKKIELRKNLYALVDDEDYEELSKYSWHLNSQGYAERLTSRKEIKRKALSMHRQIFNFPKSLIDHRNGNKLDNRRRNLRMCSKSENTINTGIRKDNTSGIKGVYFCKKTNKWVAEIIKNKKKYWIGRFENKLEAAKKYKELAIKLHGEFYYHERTVQN